jgi:hypothetical protein
MTAHRRGTWRRFSTTSRQGKSIAPRRVRAISKGQCCAMSSTASRATRRPEWFGPACLGSTRNCSNGSRFATRSVPHAAALLYIKVGAGDGRCTANVRRSPLRYSKDRNRGGRGRADALPNGRCSTWRLASRRLRAHQPMRQVQARKIDDASGSLPPQSFAQPAIRILHALARMGARGIRRGFSRPADRFVLHRLAQPMRRG